MKRLTELHTLKPSRCLVFHNFRSTRPISTKFLHKKPDRWFYIWCTKISPSKLGFEIRQLNVEIIDDVGFEKHRVCKFFCPPPRPDRLWGPPSLLSDGKQGLFLCGVKRPGRETDHSSPSSAEVQNAWSYTSAPPIRLHGVVLI
jgi:hypothetical protein